MKKETIIIREKECQKLIKKRKWMLALEYVRNKRLRGFTVTKSTLKTEFGLKPKQIEILNFVEVDNPIYKCAAPMKLYLIDEVKHKFELKKAS